MSYYSFQSFCSGFSRVTQVDFMMKSCGWKIQLPAIVEGEGIHLFDCVFDCILQGKGTFVFAVFFVRISFSSDSNKLHFWNMYNMRLCRRKIEVFEFFLIIKCH